MNSKETKGSRYVNFLKPSEEADVDNRGQLRVTCGPSDVAVWIPGDSKHLKCSLVETW
jgi:hypothetical protein